MIYSVIAVALASLATTSCSDSDSPAVGNIDLDSSSTFYNAPDQASANIYYKPAVGYVGDPMPFYDPVAGDFKILYLQDYRPNQPLTYHPIWGVSTADGASYRSLGELIPCGAETDLDAALGTGSTVYDGSLYHTFYTAHSPNAASTAGINEAVMVATSSDFVTWHKDPAFILSGATEGYSTQDYRDPFVFKGDDGKWHMLVATKREGKGVLAEYTSADLRAWESAGVFMTMMWDRFYECPDLFKIGEWWYLIYSEQHDAVRRVQYFKGRSLDELKACTAGDAGLWPDSREGMLDSRALYAGKTASDGTNRYLWGWSATRAGGSNTGNMDWAGALVAHRLVQQPDGTLLLGEVPAIAARFGQGTAEAAFTLDADSQRSFGRLGYENRISFTVKCGGDARFGVSFGRGSDSTSYPTLVVNPEGEGHRKINYEEEGADSAGFIGGADGYVFGAPADGVYNISIVTDNSVATMYIDGCAAITARVYGAARNCWSINSYNSTIEVSNLTIAKADN